MRKIIRKRSCTFGCIPNSHKLTKVISVVLAIVILGSSRPSAARDNVIDGYYVFKGDCMSVTAGNVAPILIPIISALISGALKATGSALSAYGADADAKFAATANFDELANKTTCLHIVNGPVFTNSAAFNSDTSDILKTLPLPWEEIISATKKQMADANQDPAGASKRVSDAVKTSLLSSGALLADKPRFFAELRIIPQTNNTGVTYALRSIYFGESMQDGWFKRSNAKRLAITIALYESSKSLQDALNGGTTIEFSKVPVGTSAFFTDYMDNGADPVIGWQTPWVNVAPDKMAKPFTLVAGLIETRAGSKVLSVVGTALTESAADTTKAITDKLDSSKVAKAEADAKKADADARTAAATTTVDAISKWSDAKAAFDQCEAAAKGPAADFQQAKQDFTKKRVLAVAAIANAQPLASAVSLDMSFLTDPKDCHL